MILILRLLMLFPMFVLLQGSGSIALAVAPDIILVVGLFCTGKNFVVSKLLLGDNLVLGLLDGSSRLVEATSAKEDKRVLRRLETEGKRYVDFSLSDPKSILREDLTPIALMFTNCLLVAGKLVPMTKDFPLFLIFPFLLIIVAVFRNYIEKKPRSLIRGLEYFHWVIIASWVGFKSLL